MANQKKTEQVASLHGLVKDKELIFFNYEGIEVKDFTEIRSQMREQSAQVRVVKNTFLKRVLDDIGVEAPDTLFKGMNAVAALDGDFSASAKVLYDAEKNQKVKIIGGFYEGSYVEKDYVVKLASIPSLEVLYSMLVGCLAGPVSNLVYTLDAVKDQKNDNQAEGRADGQSESGQGSKDNETEKNEEV